jgi:hypothetical protein
MEVEPWPKIIWDKKMRCYWEHLREHIVNLMRTFSELD